MKRPGKPHRVPYEIRLAAVERYLSGLESAAEVGSSIGVSEPTMRRYVRELRKLVESSAGAKDRTSTRG